MNVYSLLVLHPIIVSNHKIVLFWSICCWKRGCRKSWFTCPNVRSHELIQCKINPAVTMCLIVKFTIHSIKTNFVVWRLLDARARVTSYRSIAHHFSPSLASHLTFNSNSVNSFGGECLMLYGWTNIPANRVSSSKCMLIINLRALLIHVNANSSRGTCVSCDTPSTPFHIICNFQLLIII